MPDNGTDNHNDSNVGNDDGNDDDNDDDRISGDNARLARSQVPDKTEIFQNFAQKVWMEPPPTFDLEQKSDWI